MGRMLNKRRPLKSLKEQDWEEEINPYHLPSYNANLKKICYTWSPNQAIIVLLKMSCTKDSGNDLLSARLEKVL